MKKLSDYEYYRTDLGVLYCGDCLEVLPLIEDKVDLILTDPPYGIEYEYDKYKDVKDDKYLEFCHKWFGLLKSDLIIITTGWKYKKYWYNKNPDDEIIWYDKMKQSGGRSYYLRKTEPIFIWGKIKNKFKWDILEFNSFRNDGLRDNHTCPKPITLWIDIIKKQSDDNGLILDIFHGSGTTAVACEKLGRHWIGIEISEKYCAIAKQRIEAEASQVKMF